MGKYIVFGAVDEGRVQKLVICQPGGVHVLPFPKL